MRWRSSGRRRRVRVAGSRLCDVRVVTLVCGPPCGGKSTFVAERAATSDVVLDQDEIARECGSGREWLHSVPQARSAGRKMRGGIHDVAAMPDGRAWVIRCLASAHRRQLLAAQIRATSVIVVKPPIETVLERAAGRPNPAKTEVLVRRWFATYSPGAGETVLED